MDELQGCAHASVATGGNGPFHCLGEIGGRLPVGLEQLVHRVRFIGGACELVAQASKAPAVERSASQKDVRYALEADLEMRTRGLKSISAMDTDGLEVPVELGREQRRSLLRLSNQMLSKIAQRAGREIGAIVRYQEALTLGERFFAGGKGGLVAPAEGRRARSHTSSEMNGQAESAA